MPKVTHAESKNMWNKLHHGYGDVRKNPARVMLSERETWFIHKYLKAIPSKVLDIWIWSWRILQSHIDFWCWEIYWIDYAENMVLWCREKFKDVSSVKELEQCDVSKDDIPYEGQFDLVTSIRVIKYNTNYDEIIWKIKDKLTDDWVAVITMPNKYWVNALYKSDMPVYRITWKEFKDICGKYWLTVDKVMSNCRLPDMIYSISDSNLRGKIIWWVERSLDTLLGSTFLSKEFFVVLKK